jgi:hypothetical protein
LGIPATLNSIPETEYCSGPKVNTIGVKPLWAGDFPQTVRFHQDKPCRGETKVGIASQDEMSTPALGCFAALTRSFGSESAG